uniref:Variant erythrocyte surface antigen-1, beta subunit n=1 Tax=Babesia bovis TaxID=5865 RepID=A7AX28_BABBO|eukprot:XP_001608669.1 variant erythrocyte surface antigen-1, beta subunit [Babesia bovis T2Bo]
MSAPAAWKPHESLTQAPTNLKEAIDWVLRVTGKDGKKNEKTAPAAPPSTDNPPHCLCYLAKAIKDLLYDAKDPGSPGPSTHRYWDDLLLEQEKTLVLPVLTDLGLLSGSTSAASSTCAGGTEVIRTLIDHLALGLQKWVGWKEGDTCCLKGTEGIGGQCKCTCTGGVGGCCTGGRGTTTCHECSQCGTGANGVGNNKCYLSAYCKKNTASSGSSPSTDPFLWTSISSDSTKVHLLARIFLGSVCLIWSGLSQLGFLTCNAKGSERRWEESSLNNIENAENKGLASFMAAMGYDLDRIKNGTGYVVWKILAGKDKKNSIPWKEFASLGDKTGDSVAEYYSSIYENAKEALKKDNKTESICEQYPLLVLHILASGYFRAGSAGAKGITTLPAKPATSATSATPVSRKPRTIREILYWLSALPYSQGYRELVDRMQGKMESGTLNLEGDSYDKKTELKRDCITHYLMAACGYCPLVLIGIQGTINTSGTDSDSATPRVLNGDVGQNKQCHDFLSTLESIIKEDNNTPFNKLIKEINKLIYTTRLPWIFVLTIAWLVAVLYLAFGAIWPLDWTHMRSHCRGWFRKGSLSPWEVLMVGKKKGRSIVEFFGGR